MKENLIQFIILTEPASHKIGIKFQARREMNDGAWADVCNKSEGRKF